MIACTSTASASRRKSTFHSTPRLRSSPRTSMLSLTTSSPPRASTVFAREDGAVASLSLALCYTPSGASPPATGRRRYFFGADVGANAAFFCVFCFLVLEVFFGLLSPIAQSFLQDPPGRERPRNRGDRRDVHRNVRSRRQD